MEKIHCGNIAEKKIFRPFLLAFLLFQSGGAFFIIITFIAVIFAFFVDETAVLFLIAGALSFILLFRLFWLYIRYKKEQYVFYPKNIVYTSGNIFSDNTIEIQFDKITEISLVLPFIEHMIFSTGYITIKTAGNSTSKMIFSSIKNPEILYEKVQTYMRHNGYHLEKKKLIQEARPHILGIIGEIFNRTTGILIVVAYSIIGMTDEEGPAAIKYNDIVEIFGSIENFTVILGLIIFGMLLVYIILSYLDLRRRKYDIYVDSVFYTEGFLTKHYACIPMERIADIENRQGFWSRIFGLHDIVISSEGSDNKVIFKNMTDGEKMIENIKYLKNHITQQDIPSTLVKQEGGETNSLIGYRDTIENVIDYNHEFKAEYKMYPLKTLFLSIILFIFAIVIGIFTDITTSISCIGIIVIFSISSIIKMSFTRYIVENSSIEEKFQFLSNKHSSFTVDKISGVIMKESILDRILGTCSMTFWSIGSSANITFANLKKTATLEDDILGKVGIYRRKSRVEILPVSFGLMEYIKANFWTFLGIFLFSGITILGALLIMPATYPEGLSNTDNQIFLFFCILSFGIWFLVVILNFLYKKIYYKDSWYKQSITSEFVESIEGIIWKTKKYSHLHHIKSIKATKNPLTQTGKFIIGVAGQTLVQQRQKKYPSIKLQNAIHMNYMKDVFPLLDMIDTRLLGNPIDTTLLAKSKQDVGNSLFIPGSIEVIGILSASMMDTTFAIGVSVFFAVIFATIYWYISTKKYLLEKDRIVSEFGIIYRTKEAILYKKFNFIEKYQGFLGKIFRNATIHVYTLGSNSKDMTLSDVSGFNEIYNLLKKD